MSGQHVQAPLGQFLTLAPATSDSYPTAKPQQTQEQADAAPPARRRTSSSSTASSASTRRFLKLNPVHLGEHLGEDQADWHEVAVE